MSDKKYLTVGSVLQFSSESGEGNAFISLDLVSLKEFVDFLNKFGETHLKGLSMEQIREGVKNKEIPRISLSYYDPNEKAPDFIKKNVVLKLI
jgi:hypothetical protein